MTSNQEDEFTIWRNEQDNSRACTLAPGVTLFTKDGAKIGNAILVQKIGQTRDWKTVYSAGGIAMGSPKTVDLIDVWLIETDFGNQTRMSEKEIRTLFTLGRPGNYIRWLGERYELIAKRTTEL
jgi:hypothetical protein